LTTFRQLVGKIHSGGAGTGRPPLVAARAALFLLCTLLATVALCAADLNRMRQSLERRFGQAAVPAFEAWRAAVGTARGLTEAEQLARINDLFNRRILFADDSATWRQNDYWATPLELLGKGAGDCEDFVIAKYFSLVELGVAREKLRLTYVRARIGGPSSSLTQAHMVLAYYASPGAEPEILDNLIGEIRPAARRPDLEPVFSFNTDSLWMAGSDRVAAPVDRLTRWKDLLLRMKAEGYDP
jgi:predicted transglutaminase-like cysteine proteinase